MLSEDNEYYFVESLYRAWFTFEDLPQTILECADAMYLEQNQINSVFLTIFEVPFDKVFNRVMKLGLDFNNLYEMLSSASFIEAGSYAAIVFNEVLNPEMLSMIPITDIHATKGSYDL